MKSSLALCLFFVASVNAFVPASLLARPSTFLKDGPDSDQSTQSTEEMKATLEKAAAKTPVEPVTKVRVIDSSFIPKQSSSDTVILSEVPPTVPG